MAACLPGMVLIPYSLSSLCGIFREAAAARDNQIQVAVLLRLGTIRIGAWIWTSKKERY